MSSSNSLNSSFFASIFFTWAGEAVLGENRNRWFCWSRLKSFYITDESPNVDLSQSLGKQARLKRFNIDPICFNKGIDLILSDSSRCAGWRLSRSRWVWIQRRCCWWPAWCNGGPHPKAALASLEDPNTLAEEKTLHIVLKDVNCKCACAQYWNK